MLGFSEAEVGSGGKVLAFARVPDTMVSRGLQANEWLAAALEPLGGRGGGKSGSAQGQAPTSAELGTAKEAAAEFVGRVLADEEAGLGVGQ